MLGGVDVLFPVILPKNYFLELPIIDMLVWPGSRGIRTRPAFVGDLTEEIKIRRVSDIKFPQNMVISRQWNKGKCSIIRILHHSLILWSEKWQLFKPNISDFRDAFHTVFLLHRQDLSLMTNLDNTNYFCVCLYIMSLRQVGSCLRFRLSMLLVNCFYDTHSRLEFKKWN